MWMKKNGLCWRRRWYLSSVSLWRYNSIWDIYCIVYIIFCVDYWCLQAEPVSEELMCHAWKPQRAGFFFIRGLLISLTLFYYYELISLCKLYVMWSQTPGNVNYSTGEVLGPSSAKKLTLKSFSTLCDQWSAPLWGNDPVGLMFPRATPLVNKYAFIEWPRSITLLWLQRYKITCTRRETLADLLKRLADCWSAFICASRRTCKGFHVEKKKKRETTFKVNFPLMT